MKLKLMIFLPESGEEGYGVTFGEIFTTHVNGAGDTEQEAIDSAIEILNDIIDERDLFTYKEMSTEEILKFYDFTEEDVGKIVEFKEISLGMKFQGKIKCQKNHTQV